MLGGGGGGCRISHHLRECCNNNLNYYYYYHHQIHYNNNIYNTTTRTPLELSSSSFIVNLGRPSSNALRLSCLHCVQPSCSSNSQQGPHMLSDCLSQSEDGLQQPRGIMCTVAGGIVALGKFDALHIGHRELAIHAAKMGVPYLLSFVGMAEVLGWEPRAPIVAKCDRKRVLSTWSALCGGIPPKEFEIEFSKVRSLTPRQFVEKLSKELGVCGVVAGENYRFGYRAAGNAKDLVRLCEEYGMEACIISSVMDKNHNSTCINSSNLKEQGQVSSTRVRAALAKGDMKYVSELLGRHHRLILAANDDKRVVRYRNRVSAPVSCLLNLPPKEGLYEKCLVFVGGQNVIPCRVVIEKMHIHLELDEVDTCTDLTCQDTRLLGIEFGEFEFDGV